MLGAGYKASRHMRLVTWNCKMAAHKNKLDELLRAFDPDVVVLPECASPDVVAARRVYAAATSYAWAGGYAPKGLAVLTFKGATLAGVPRTAAGSAIAARVTCASLSFNLLGVWAKGEGLPAYVENVNAALKQHDAFLRQGPSVVAGDLNSSATFDRQTRGGHTKLVAHLESMGLVSAYHHHFNEEHGAEKRSTYFQHHKHKLTFHLDYIFRPREWGGFSTVEVPEPAPWLEFSDHVPVVLDVSQQR